MTTTKKILVILTQILVMMGFAIAVNSKVEAKELTGSVSDIDIWLTNYRPVQPTSDGVYPLVEERGYTFQVGLDLTHYGSDVSDGDYINFAVPAPYTVADETFDILDTDTGIAIGTATVSSAGQEQGGQVFITLKNIQTYLQQKNAQEIFGIKGSFYVDFRVTETASPVTTTFTNIKDVGTKDIVIKVDKSSAGRGDNSGVLGRENISKYAGVLTNRPYDSEALGKSGTWQHPWAVRINASKKTYDSLTIRDDIDQTGTAVQFIPETMKVEASEVGFGNNYVIQSPVTLTEGVDYTVSYSNDYSSFVINIPNAGNRAYYLTYATTSPANGSSVGNIIQLESPEGAVPINDTTTETQNIVSRQSQITQGGTLQLETASRITIEKIDEESGQALAGAVFKITKPDGTEIMLDPTDSDGITQSPSFTAAEMAAGDFTITEVTAPEGYNLDETPRVITVTQAGVIESFTNRRSDSLVNPPSGTSSSSSDSSNPTDSSSSGDSSDPANSSSSSNSSGDNSGSDSVVNGTQNDPGTGSSGQGGNSSANHQSVSSQKKVLPSTGQETNGFILFGGLFLMVTAMVLLWSTRKNRK